MERLESQRPSGDTDECEQQRDSRGQHRLLHQREQQQRNVDAYLCEDWPVSGERDDELCEYWDVYRRDAESSARGDRDPSDKRNDQDAQKYQRRGYSNELSASRHSHRDPDNNDPTEGGRYSWSWFDD